MSTIAIVVVSIGGFIAAFFIFLYAASGGLRRAGHDFFRCLVENRYEDAYSYLGAGLKSTVKASDFIQFLRKNEIFDVERYYYGGDFSIGLIGNGHFGAHIIRKDRVCIKVHLELQKQSGDWKIATMAVQLVIMQTPPPFNSN